MVTTFNSLAGGTYRVGQNVYILTLDVPDLWVSSIESTSVPYTYINDEEVLYELDSNGYLQVGYYRLSALEEQKVDLTNYVSATDYASTSKGGVIKVSSTLGTSVNGSGVLIGTTKTASGYKTSQNTTLISKGTLEQVWNDRTQTISESDYEALTTKDSSVLYLIPEE